MSVKILSLLFKNGITLIRLRLKPLTSYIYLPLEISTKCSAVGKTICEI